MTLALSLAQALNCEADASSRPCGSCNPCHRVSSLTHADVQVIQRQGRAEISIDQIREIEKSATLKPFEGRNRVYIIDDAEKLSTEAANSLLKTLEEPPPYVQLILVTKNERLLLPTVLSRCQKLDLRPLPIIIVEQALMTKWKVSPERAGLLARFSQGCIGWAVEASRNESIISERTVLLKRLQQLASDGKAERFAYANELANQFNRDREMAEGVLNLWVSWWRDLMLTRGGCRDHVINVDQKDTLPLEANKFHLSAIKGFINSILDAVRALEQNSNPRLVLEVLMLNIPKKARS
jgi:DNA polymerase-3 subunit delta'